MYATFFVFHIGISSLLCCSRYFTYLFICLFVSHNLLIDPIEYMYTLPTGQHSGEPRPSGDAQRQAHDVSAERCGSVGCAGWAEPLQVQGSRAAHPCCYLLLRLICCFLSSHRLPPLNCVQYMLMPDTCTAVMMQPLYQQVMIPASLCGGQSFWLNVHGCGLWLHS